MMVLFGGEGPPNCIIDTPTCEGFAASADTWFHWVGLRSTDNSGQLNCCGCDLGYANCLQDSDHVGGYRAREEGNRWIRPSLTMESRDAYGILHDLRSKVAHPVPGTMNYEIAPCHTEFGGECFDQDLCGCDLKVFPCSTASPDCTGIGEPCLGRYADVFGYVGSTWVRGQRINCRETTQHGPRSIRVEPDSLLQAATVRLDHRSLLASDQTSCASNRMALCVGTNVDNPCSYSDPPIGYYMGNHVNIFAFANVRFDGLGLRERGSLTPAALIALNIKRAALLKAASFPALSQIDSFPVSVGENGGGNAFIDYWNRDWGGGLPLSERVALGRFLTYENCQLAGSGCRVVVDLYVSKASIEMSLVPHETYDGDADQSEQEKMFPFARFRLSVRIGAVARIVGECSVTRAWRGDTGPIVLDIFNDETGETLPIVTPAGEDSILFLDDAGVAFLPPSRADWFGYKGHLGIDGVLPIVGDEGNVNNLVRCCRLAKQLHGTEIRGWPYDVGSGDTDFEGHITLGFTDTGNFCGSCGNLFPDICGGGGGGGGGKIPPVGIQPGPRVAVPIPDGPQTPDVAQPIPPADQIPGGPSLIPPVLTPVPVPPASPAPPRIVIVDGFDPYPHPPVRRPPDELSPLPAPPDGGRDRAVVENDPPVFLV